MNRVLAWRLCLAMLVIGCAQKRDPEFPQYIQPRAETLAWRRLTAQPSPELSVVPLRQGGSESTPALRPAAHDSPDAAAEPTGVGRCRSVAAPATCKKRVHAFACGIHKPEGGASLEPPVELLFFAGTLTEAEALATRAEHEGAVALPARSCRFVEVDACNFRSDLQCTDESARVVGFASVAF